MGYALATPVDARGRLGVLVMEDAGLTQVMKATVHKDMTFLMLYEGPAGAMCRQGIIALILISVPPRVRLP